MSGVGSLVLEKKGRGQKKSAAAAAASGRKRKPKEEEESEEDMEDEGERKTAKGKKQVTPPKKRVKKAASAASDEEAEASPKKKKGQSSVDTSKPLRPQEARREEYMKITVKELNDILAINQVAPPRDKKKDALAWQCVYAEVLGAPKGKCPRCLHGRLKPAVKPAEYGRDIVKGVDKWQCPGWFDEETDALKFCNKKWKTDGSEVATVPFKGLGQITDEDLDAMHQRKALERAEREEIRARKAEEEGFSSGGEQKPHHHPGDHRPEAVIHASVAPRLADKDEFPDFITDPSNSASSASPRAPPKPSPVLTPHQSEVLERALSQPRSPRGRSRSPSPARAKPAKRSPSPAASHESSPASSSSIQGPASSTPPPCAYGADCFRQNAEHLAMYSHPAKTVGTVAAAAKASAGGDSGRPAAGVKAEEASKEQTDAAVREARKEEKVYSGE